MQNGGNNRKSVSSITEGVDRLLSYRHDLEMKQKIQKIPNFDKLPLSTKLITTWFGFGLIRPAPGTWGSFGGLLAFYALYYFSGQFGFAPQTFALFMLPFAVFLFFIGIEESNIFERITGKKDCSNIVIDEVAALWGVLCFAAIAKGNFWVHGILAFLLFRFFDILKPFPISWFERRYKGGFGVMIDDVIAGIFAVISFCLIGIFTRNFFI